MFFFKSYVTIAPPPTSKHPWFLHYSGRGSPATTSPLPLNTYSHNIATRRPPHPSNMQQHTTTHKNTQQQTTTHNNSTQQHITALGYIKLPMYQLFLLRLYFIVLRSATALLGALEGVGPENIDFFWPKWHSLRSCHFRTQKSLDFQGPPLPMPLVMLLHSSKPLRTAPQKQQVH